MTSCPPPSSRDRASAALRSNLSEVRAQVVSGTYASIGPFAVSVRDVFAACYMTHGHPDRSALSKKCERLDSVFEQNVTLLPRHLRDAASLFAAPTAVLGAAEETKPAAANSYTGRRAAQVQAVSTLRLVESFKQRTAAQADMEKARAAKERRERAVAEAEAWAAEAVDPRALDELRRSYDVVSLTTFLVSFAGPLSIPLLANATSFALIEYEIALLSCPHASLLFRVALDALLRHSTVKNGQFPPPPKTTPSGASLAAQLAQRVDAWARTLARVERQEARGEEVEEWDLVLSEGYGLREIVDRLGELAPLSTALRARGLDGLTAWQRAALLHGVAEQALETDRDIYKRMHAAEIEASRPTLLGRDAAGRWYYHFGALVSDTAEGRLYSLTSPWR